MAFRNSDAYAGEISTLDLFFAMCASPEIHVPKAKQIQVPGCLRYFSWMTSYPVIRGLFHKPIF